MKWPIDWRVVATMPSGRITAVFDVVHPTLGPVVVKRTRPERNEQLQIQERIESEIDLLRRLGGRGWPRLFGRVCFPDGVGFVMERVPGHVLDWSSLTNSSAVAQVGLQIVDALRGLHSLGFAHRDLSPSNVLGVGGAAVCLCDLGIARAFGEQPTAVEGTLTTVPPGQAQCRKVHETDDFQSLALLLAGLQQGTAIRPVENRMAAINEAQKESFPSLGEAIEPVEPIIRSLWEGQIDEAVKMMRVMIREYQA